MVLQVLAFHSFFFFFLIEYFFCLPMRMQETTQGLSQWEITEQSYNQRACRFEDVETELIQSTRVMAQAGHHLWRQQHIRPFVLAAPLLTQLPDNITG